MKFPKYLMYHIAHGNILHNDPNNQCARMRMHLVPQSLRGIASRMIPQYQEQVTGQIVSQPFQTGLLWMIKHVILFIHNPFIKPSTVSHSHHPGSRFLIQSIQRDTYDVTARSSLTASSFQNNININNTTQTFTPYDRYNLS